VRLIQSGRLKGWRRGRFWEADAVDLERFIRESSIHEQLAKR
jgi:hypothetical protein